MPTLLIITLILLAIPIFMLIIKTAVKEAILEAYNIIKKKISDQEES